MSEDSSNVIVIHADLGAPSSPRDCLSMLQNLGGNVRAYAEKFTDDRQKQIQILAQTRRILETEPLLLEYWDKSVRQYQLNYWALLQCDALEKLSWLIKDDDKGTIAKSILAPFTAQLIADAKKTNDDAPLPEQDEPEDQYSSDDAVLAEALGLNA